MRAHVCRSHLVLLLTFYAYEKCADYTDRCAGAISKSRGSAAGSRVVGSFHRRDWKSCTLKSVNIPTLSLQNTERQGRGTLNCFSSVLTAASGLECCMSSRPHPRHLHRCSEASYKWSASLDTPPPRTYSPAFQRSSQRRGEPRSEHNCRCYFPATH